MAATRHVKAWLGYIPFRGAAALFGFFPETVIRWLGESGGKLWYARSSDRIPLLTSHMRRVLGPEATDESVDTAVRGMFRSYGRYWAETFWFRPRRKTAIARRVEHVNFEPIYAAQRAGRGIVFAVPHLGNWEIAGIVANEIGSPIMAVAEDLSNQHITKWFVNLRAEFDIEIVLTTDPRLRSKLIRRLKDGGAIALLADRDVTGGGIEVNFFGAPASIPVGPIVFTELTGASLIPVAAYFQEGAGHRIVVLDEVVLPDAGNRSERVTAGAQLLVRSLEQLIVAAPSQWHLFQPHWIDDADQGGAS
jgi:KDO2-lipid IV(A) lauroyltransferase